MKIKIFTAFKVLLLSFVLTAGLSYVYAWTAPTYSPPSGNVSAPINVGSVTQTKTGDICTIFGGTTKCLSMVVLLPPATASLSASPTSIAYGAASTITWSSTNATSCTAGGAWSGAKATSGSVGTGALTASQTYTLYCTGAGGNSATQSVTVAVGAAPAPTLTFSASPTTVANGGSSTGTWSSTNATSCTASGSWSGTQALSGSASTGPLPGPANYTYTLSCTGVGGTISRSVTVAASAPVYTPGSTSYTGPGSYTFTVPPVVYALNIEAWGAGGRGGDGSASMQYQGYWTYTGGGGGGAGGYVKTTLPVSPGQTYTVNVGAGTTATTPYTVYGLWYGIAFGAQRGNSGGNSSFGSSIVAYGGGGGGMFGWAADGGGVNGAKGCSTLVDNGYGTLVPSGYSSVATAGVGGTAVGGTTNTTGAAGLKCNDGGSMYGSWSVGQPGAAGGAGVASLVNGVRYGAGGAGGNAYIGGSVAQSPGSAGGNGAVIISW